MLKLCCKPTGVAVFNTTGFGLRRPPKTVSAHSLGDIALACTADDSLVSPHLLHASPMLEVVLQAQRSVKCGIVNDQGSIHSVGVP